MPIAFAWNLIGFDGSDGYVRIVGGRTLYESVDYNDDTPGTHVRLSRLTTRGGRLRQINRWVDPDTMLEIVPDEASS